MPAAATRPTGKRSRRGGLSEGRPTKQTPEVGQKIANAIALSLADDEAASLAGISDMTLTTWRRDPAFLGIYVSTRLAMRLSKIESGADGWQGTAWLLERLYPSRLSRPEVQTSLQNTTTNALINVISKGEYERINTQVEESRAKVREMFTAYRPGALNNGNENLDRNTAISDSVRQKFANFRPGGR
jgi:hypothetical protein